MAENTTIQIKKLNRNRLRRVEAEIGTTDTTRKPQADDALEFLLDEHEARHETHKPAR